MLTEPEDYPQDRHYHFSGLKKVHSPDICQINRPIVDIVWSPYFLQNGFLCVDHVALRRLGNLVFDKVQLLKLNFSWD